MIGPLAVCVMMTAMSQVTVGTQKAETVGKFVISKQIWIKRWHSGASKTKCLKRKGQQRHCSSEKYTNYPDCF